MTRNTFRRNVCLQLAGVDIGDGPQNRLKCCEVCLIIDSYNLQDCIRESGDNQIWVGSCDLESLSLNSRSFYSYQN